MTFKIRTDLPAKADYYELFQSTGWNGDGIWTEDMLHEAVRNSWYVVTVYKGDRLVASGRMVSDGVIQCILCEMMVLPDYRNRGLGSQIMDHLLDYCKSKGIRWVQLACAKGKQGFYERYGFRERPADAPGMGLFL
ncbi:GNAT family N-acetyltransferase [Paenibacillus chitinolyticus]|uniref:GNAT family N-acetyltransferase n=1 Tax=Paenibacillus chitinolyticus TaxID=79263 RepID=UPI00366A560B